MKQYFVFLKNGEELIEICSDVSYMTLRERKNHKEIYDNCELEYGSHSYSDVSAVYSDISWSDLIDELSLKFDCELKVVFK